MNPALFSVIIPTFNASRTLRKCLDSVCNQEFKKFEIWVIDGLSKDDTLDIVKEYQQNHVNIFFISEKDNGIYDAMNKGIYLSGGEWLYFLGSDDFLCDSTVFRKISNVISSKSEIDFLYGNVFWGDYNKVYDGRFGLLKLFQHNICHQSIFIKRKVMLELGCFDLKYPVLADYAINMRLFLSGKYKILYVSELIAFFTVGGSSSYIPDPFYEERYHIRHDLPKRLNFIEYATYMYKSSPNDRGNLILFKKACWRIIHVFFNICGFRSRFIF